MEGIELGPEFELISTIEVETEMEVEAEQGDHQQGQEIGRVIPEGGGEMVEAVYFLELPSSSQDRVEGDHVNLGDINKTVDNVSSDVTEPEVADRVYCEEVIESGGGGESGGNYHFEAGDGERSRSPVVSKTKYSEDFSLRPSEIKLNTKGSCFFCLKEVKNDFDESVGEDLEEFWKAFNQLYLYLHINWKQIYRDFTPPPKPKWNPLDKPQLKLVMCEPCGELAERVKSLKRELDLIKKQIDSSIDRIVNVMEESKKDCEEGEKREREFWKKMKQDKKSDDYEIVETLRESVIEKVNLARDNKGRFRAFRVRRGGVISSTNSAKNRRGRPRSGHSSTSHSTSPPDPVVTCQICSKSFTAVVQLTNHLLNAHFLQDNPQNKCPYCPQKYKSSNYLKSHLKGTHKIGTAGPHSVQLSSTRGNIATVIITEGNASQVTSKNINKKNVQAAPSAPPLTKTVAMVNLEDLASEDEEVQNLTESETESEEENRPKKKDYRQHLKRDPPSLQRILKLNSKQANCKFCKRTFLTVAGLKRHYEKNHREQQGNIYLFHRTEMRVENRLEYKCAVCYQKFPGEISVREHEKICPLRHCKECGKRFQTLDGLKYHLGKEHGDKRRRRY